MSKIKLPYNFKPRDYQRPAIEAITAGCKRAVWIMHRRAGKDKTLINIVAREMYKRVGIYYYFFPTYKQGKKILWKGIGKDGMKFMDHIPMALRKRTDNTEMLIEMKNGSLFQIIGTDDYGSIKGTNPIFCVFSEYSYQNPVVWFEVISPILDENDGTAIFNYTPQAKNHGYKLYNMAKNNPNWFCELLTIRDTRRPDGTPVISEQKIQEKREEGMDEDLIQQEYYCSFEAGIKGSYYANNISLAKKKGRWEAEDIYNPRLTVDTWWDLGVGDAMSIWFSQTVANEIRLIDYYESSGDGLPYYINYLKEKPYRYGEHYAPFDIDIRELTTGKTRIETARTLGINFRIVPKISIDDGIDCVRRMFSRFWFNKETTEQGREAVACYHKEWDEKRKEFKNIPYHDWSSHGSDGLRYLAVGHREFKGMKITLGSPLISVQQYNQDINDFTEM